MWQQWSAGATPHWVECLNPRVACQGRSRSWLLKCLSSLTSATACMSGRVAALYKDTVYRRSSTTVHRWWWECGAQPMWHHCWLSSNGPRYIDRLVAEGDCGVVHYLLNNVHAPKCLSERLERRSDVSDRRTRVTENMELELPRVRTEQARNFFQHRAVRLWNSMPADVCESRTSAGCRRRCRKALNAR